MRGWHLLYLHLPEKPGRCIRESSLCQKRRSGHSVSILTKIILMFKNNHNIFFHFMDAIEEEEEEEGFMQNDALYALIQVQHHIENADSTPCPSSRHRPSQ